MKNVWYIVAEKKDGYKFGYKSIQEKGHFFDNFEDANIHRIYMQPDYDNLLVVLKRICEVMKP